MRIVVFVVVGIVVGVVIARMRTDDGRAAVEAGSAAAAGSTASARARWTGPVQSGSVRQRDLQATDSRYDAFLLSKENQELSAKEIFDSEPRDPAFAPTLEKRVHDALATAFRELELEDKIQGVKTECKTLSCYTRIEVSKEHGWEVYNAINGVMLGDSQEPGIDESDPQHTYVTFGNLYRASTRDDAEYDKFLRGATKPSLEAAKQRLVDARHEAPR
jgi:hypothetical protein